MFETRGIFLRKEDKLSVQKCIIEAVITIPESEFKEFQNSLYERQSFILDNLDKMYVGKSGEFHTILVVGDESSDGVLVESEGYDYGRCVSFLPEAKAFLKRKMEEMTDKIITDRRNANSDELVRIRFSELSEMYGIDVTPNQGLFSYPLPDGIDYQGYYGLQIDLTGVKASRIYDFSAMLAGYCPIEDYYKWVRDDSFLPENKMTFD